jgi:hypothetical protein
VNTLWPTSRLNLSNPEEHGIAQSLYLREHAEIQKELIKEGRPTT